MHSFFTWLGLDTRKVHSCRVCVTWASFFGSLGLSKSEPCDCCVNFLDTWDSKTLAWVALCCFLSSFLGSFVARSMAGWLRSDVEVPVQNVSLLLALNARNLLLSVPWLQHLSCWAVFVEKVNGFSTIRRSLKGGSLCKRPFKGQPPVTWIDFQVGPDEIQHSERRTSRILTRRPRFRICWNLQCGISRVGAGGGARGKLNGSFQQSGALKQQGSYYKDTHTKKTPPRCIETATCTIDYQTKTLCTAGPLPGKPSSTK